MCLTPVGIAPSRSSWVKASGYDEVTVSKAANYVPSMSDEAVVAKTGKTWKEWFRLLDEANAARLEHRHIAALLREKHELPGWWSQNVTVEYERSRGLREPHQVTGGYSVSVTRTLPASVSRLYSATADATQRAKWFPPGVFQPSSQTKSKYIRGAWKKQCRLEFGFYAKGAGKAQIALAVTKLAGRVAVEAERSAWKRALSRLEVLLES